MEADGTCARQAAPVSQAPAVSQDMELLTHTHARLVVVPHEALDSESRAQQLAQRVAHLEADLQLLRHRKAELEIENEDLAAAAKRPDLQRRLAEAQAQVARLEEENSRHRAESARRAELEEQQAEIARSFVELQRIVSQLVKRLHALDNEKARLVEEKRMAEVAAGMLRAELEKVTRRRSMLSKPVPSRPGSALFRGDSSEGPRGPPCATGPSSPTRVALGYKMDSSLSGRPGRRGNTCRLRCRGDTQTPGRQTPGRAPVPGGYNKKDLETAKAQVELLKEQLRSEQEAGARAREAQEASLHESMSAAARTSQIQSELHDFLSSWNI